MQKKKLIQKDTTKNNTSPVINVDPIPQNWADCFMKFIADLSGNITSPKRDIN